MLQLYFRSGGSWSRGGAERPRPHMPQHPPIFNAPMIVLQLIGILSAAAIITWNLPINLRRIIEYGGSVIPARFLAGPEAAGGLLSQLAPLIGHVALHATVAHLFFNMIWLLALGAPVARRLGADDPRKAMLGAGLFVNFFLVSGIGGALAFIAINPNDAVPMVGASGAVSGLLGAVARFAFRRPAYFTRGGGGLAPLFDRSVLGLSAAVIALNLYFAFGGAGFGGGGGQIAWEAHIGGYLCGLLTFPFFDRLANRP